ncbi:hypothetical protein EG329_002297 [Mollisiaceae sp. DMI_Dod_QoI]|nr:hypothetical protein EG329_002297 [Helotiales sp. DMI_Dod_QoI]
MDATSRIPPEAPPALAGLTPASVLAETATLLARSAALRRAREGEGEGECAAPFANVVRPLVDDANRAATRLRILSVLLTSVWPDGKVREASRECETHIANAETAALMRADVAALVAAVFRDQKQEQEQELPQAREELDAQDLYLLGRMHSEFTRSGAALRDESARDRLQVAMAELSQLRVAAQKALTEADDGVWFDAHDLAGVPESIVSKLATRAQKEVHREVHREEVFVKFSNEQRVNVMRHARKESTRRRMYVAQQYRFSENVERLAKIVALRDEVARLLGFGNHAALKMEEKMASSVGEVEDQLRELRECLEPLAKADTEKLLLLKEKHSATAQDEVQDPSKLYVWDRTYYLNKQKKESLSIDTTELAKYFEARHTLSRMLALFAELFGMQFEQTEADVWHEDVMVYAVWDSVIEDGDFLGYLYVDLFERQGKYRAAHHILMAPGFIEGNGTKHYPASVLGCSFPTPTPFRPCLLQQGDVKTMFHELGHAIHNIVAHTKYAIPHSRDFIEIPSIMLENWIWIPRVLVDLGKHYTFLGVSKERVRTSSEPFEGASIGQPTEKAGGTLPLALAQAISRTKTYDQAHKILSQVQPALFDLAVHTPADHRAALEMDATALWNQTKHEIIQHSFGNTTEDWGFGQGGFPHIFRKYDAGYFAYPL